MRVERYIADDMRQAMARVRESLGSDALILSNRRVNGQTELIAAIDDSGTLTSPPRLAAASRLKKPAPKTASKTVTTTNTNTDPLLSDIKSELGRLRNMFEGELSQLSWRDMQEKQPNRVAIQNRLESAGLSYSVSNKIADRVMPCNDLDLAWKNALKMAAKLTPFSKRNPIEEGGVIALVGSTGVGKTTTAAKIAAQFAKRHGANNVALISADNTRLGGKEQLLSYGSSLGIPVQFVSNTAEMQSTLTSLSQKKLVIIDTAGISQRSMDIAKRLNVINIKNRKISFYLVLSSTAQESVNNEVIKVFSKIDPVAAIITRTDECGMLGPVMSSLIRQQLPLVYISNGQKVPDDLIPADHKFLVANLVKNYRTSLKNTQGKIPALQHRSVVNA